MNRAIGGTRLCGKSIFEEYRGVTWGLVGWDAQDMKLGRDNKYVMMPYASVMGFFDLRAIPGG